MFLVTRDAAEKQVAKGGRHIRFWTERGRIRTGVDFVKTFAGKWLEWRAPAMYH